MRILGIQNFTLNSLNKYPELKKSNNVSPMKNSLERTPAFDTVSFGKFGGKYSALTEDELFIPLFEATRDVMDYNTLKNAEYLSIEPTEETIQKWPAVQVYEAKLVSFREFRSWASDEDVKIADDLMRRHIDEFNKFYGYKPGWEKHLDLRTPEDFVRAAALARHLSLNSYFPKGDYYDEMRDIDTWCFTHLKQ